MKVAARLRARACISMCESTTCIPWAPSPPPSAPLTAPRPSIGSRRLRPLPRNGNNGETSTDRDLSPPLALYGLASAVRSLPPVILRSLPPSRFARPAAPDCRRGCVEDCTSSVRLINTAMLSQRSVT